MYPILDTRVEKMEGGKYWEEGGEYFEAYKCKIW